MCFHQRVSNLHFELTRPRLLVWAQAIKAGKATIDKIPNAMPFKADQALKKPSKSVSQAAANAPSSPKIHTTAPPTPVAPTAATLLPTPTGFPPYQSYPFPPMNPMPMMPFPGYPNPYQAYMNPWFPAQPSPPTKQHLDEPPSSPLRCDITVSDFCQLYDIGHDAEAALDNLDFEIGDDLECVTEKQWMDAGFKPLAWNRVKKIYRKFKRENWV